MPNQSKIPYKHLKSSDYPRVITIDAEFTRALDYDCKNRERSYRNNRMYHAVDAGQWNPKDIVKLGDVNRQAAQFNITAPKVDTLAGELLSETYDYDFKPVEGPRDSLTKSIQDTWYSDKELCRYDEQMEKIVIDGLIYAGDMKMMISHKYNSLGNIYFKRTEPGYLVRDPYWRSDDDSECEKCWEIFYMDAIELQRKFGISNPIVDSAVNQLKLFGGDYQNPDNDFNQRIQMQTIGHLYRVIEYHWMEILKTTRIVGQKLNSDRYIPFPITEDKAKLKDFMLRNKVDPNTMMPVEYEDPIHKFNISCPQVELSKLLREGMGKIQIKRLPYFQFTVGRFQGQNKGIVDDIVDIQETINKRESKLTDLVSTATGGGKLANRDMFKTPDERKEFENRANDPAYVGWVDGDDLTNNRAIHYLNTNTYPSTLINQLERMWDVIDRVSRVPASMSSRSESANESGRLHAQKMAVARLANVTLFNRLKKLRHDMGEAYFEQWPWAYKGLSREFSTRDGKHKTVLNERVFRPEEGKWYIRNRPDQIPRCSVIITEKPSSPSTAMEKQAKFGEFYNMAVQAKQPEYANFFFGEILKTEVFDDEAEAQLGILRVLNNVRNLKRIGTEIKNMDAAGKQADFAGAQAMMNLEQLTASIQQPGQEALPVSEVPEEEFAPVEFPSQSREPGLQP